MTSDASASRTPFPTATTRTRTGLHTTAGRSPTWRGAARRPRTRLGAGGGQAAREGEADRAGANRAVPGSGLVVEFDEFAGTGHGLRIAANRPYADGVVTGTARWTGASLRIQPDSPSSAITRRGVRHQDRQGDDHALKVGCPIVGFNDGGGARIQEGVVALGLSPTSSTGTSWPPGDPADLADHGRVRAGGLLAGHHGLHPDGGGHLAHVHHRP